MNAMGQVGRKADFPGLAGGWHYLDTAATAQAQTEADLPALHWFTPIQQLTLFGFFTSEVGATQVLRYEPVPGEYIGDLEYDGGPPWAT